jgi:dTDP-4-amino-4,6-dideoxygalactose transaminase
MWTTPGVRSLPTLPLSELGGIGRRHLPSPLHERGVTFWFSARVALFQAIAALGLRPGSAVALPAFCCGSEIEPFVYGGLTPRFFRVTKELDPEPESFSAALQGSSAALVTHYFGFAADIGAARDACRAAGIPLIEDCAHALYSRDSSDWLGSRADVAVFSVMKTLPVPDGGALVTNVQTTTSFPLGSTPSRHVIARRTRSLLIRHLQAHPLRPISWAAHLPRVARNQFGVTRAEPNRDTAAGLVEYARFDPHVSDSRMSSRSMRLLGRTSHAEVRNLRRRNYDRILEAVRNVQELRPLFPSLPEGACPLALPVVARDPDAFRRRLRGGPGLGVKQMWPWFHPSVSWLDFPFERKLKESVFILPVHQSLRGDEIDRIITVLNVWSRTGVAAQ